MTTIYLVANDQLLSVALNPKLAAGDQNSVTLHVDFSEEWDGFARSAVFFTSNDSTPYEKVLTDGKCTIPAEVLADSGILYIGARGVNADNAAVKTSSLVKYKISDGAPAGTATEAELTPDVYQQILTAYGRTDNAVAVERARIDNLIAGGAGDGVTVYDFSFSTPDTAMHYGTITSDGVHALINIEEMTYTNDGGAVLQMDVTKIPEHLLPLPQLVSGGNFLMTDSAGLEWSIVGGMLKVNIPADVTLNYHSVSCGYDLKTASIPELNDIRVGHDGTVYDSAGAAVRGQIKQVLAAIDEVEMALDAPSVEGVAF